LGYFLQALGLLDEANFVGDSEYQQIKLQKLEYHDDDKISKLSVNENLKSLSITGFSKLSVLDISQARSLSHLTISASKLEYVKFGVELLQNL
jgi:hypothetical protein